eukprot:scaffold10114_cov38-Cyclotella_meneghiniana.AAC.2
MAANIGEKGHPCEKPSPGSAYKASANGDRDGDTRDRVGRELLACSIVMYFSTQFRIVEMTMSQPPCTPTAKL